MAMNDPPGWFSTSAKLLRLNVKRCVFAPDFIKICVNSRSAVGVFDLLTVACRSNVKYNIYSNFIGLSARGRKRPTPADVDIELIFDRLDSERGNVFLAESVLYARRHLGFDLEKAEEIISGIFWGKEILSEDD